MTARLLVLSGGAPWGFRMHGGVDCAQTLRITRVNPGSKAAASGVREGDIITSINGQSTRQLSNTDAHALLRNAGQSLRLGLNEELSGSPSRRQFKTIHQETSHQEIVKRSSITTYSIKKEESSISSKLGDTKNNEINVNGTSNCVVPTSTVFSQRPTLGSSSSTSSSSGSTLKEDLRNTSTDNALASQRSSYTNCTVSPTNSVFSEDDQSMSDNVGASSSKSKRRRQRKKNKKISENVAKNTQTCDRKDIITVCKTEYLVDSPKELSSKVDAKKNNKPVKSKSLDDDDMVKIQELSEVSESEDKEKDTQAIISEASESEIEWEETSCLNTPSPMLGTLSTLTLPIDTSYVLEQVTLISPEEEKTLRNFLHSLNLVTGPEEAAKQVYQKTSVEDIKRRKARKRAELEQYFLPIAQNPRYLDVISEEAGDKDSDMEHNSLTKNLKQGTPELDIPPSVPPRANRDRRRTTVKTTAFISPVPQAPPILVDTKIVDNRRNISQGICNTSNAEESTSTVEVVFLDESTGSNTPEELTSSTSDSYLLTSSNEDIDIDISNIEVNENHFSKYENSEINENNHFESRNMILEREDIKKNDLVLSQLTPPPTPDNVSPRDDIKYSSYNAETINDTKVDYVKSPKSEQITDTNNSSVDFKSVELTTTIDNTHLKENISSTMDTNETPPPPPSISPPSSNSSSRSSSLCTAKYIPSVSSLTDMCSINEEFHHPLTLREICLKYLVTIPFGKDILQELADISKALESLPFSQLVQLASSSSRKEINTIPSEVSVSKSAKQMKREEIYSKEDKNRSEELIAAVSENDSNKVPPEIPVRKYRNINYSGSKAWMEITSQNLDSVHGSKLQTEHIVPIIREWQNKSNKLDQGNAASEDNTSGICAPVTADNSVLFTQSLDQLKETIIPITKGWSESEQRTERIVPITNERTECSNKKLNFREINEISRDLFISSNEIDILKETLNLDNINKKPREKIIPVARSWSSSQQGLSIEDDSLGGNTEIKNDCKIGKEINKTIIIPIEKEWTQKKESLGVNNKKTWIEKKSDLKREEIKEYTIPITFDGCKGTFPDISSDTDKSEGLSSTKNKNERTTEPLIPITKNLGESSNSISSVPEKTFPQTQNIPLYQHWSNTTSTKEESSIEKNEQGKPKEYSIPFHIETETKQPDLPLASHSVEDPTIMPIISKEITIPIRQDWVAMPTERNPNVLLCLSPKQKEELEKTKKIPNEAEKLLELHQKFMNRVSHEEIKKMQEEKVTITNVRAPTNNRLLDIIKEEPSVTASTEDTNYLYFIERNTKASSSCGPKNASDARLKAKDLSEWLNLARTKSMSESNLSTVPGIPENNLRDLFTPELKPQRRTSLPYDICERQMLYLQEKEREIQKQLEELEEEKRRIGADMAQAKEFKVEDYNFSRKGDFAETKSRPTSMPVMPTEFFRQQMYQEYMDKFQAREERKQHKVIKVSSSSKQNVNQETDKPGKEIIHPVHIEKEFMDKVKQKQKEGKLEKVKSLEKESSSEKELNDGGEPVLVMEGEKLKEAKKLPKHLREFVDITKQSISIQEQEAGIWSPGQKQESRESPTKQQRQSQDLINTPQDEAIQPIWTPKSASASPTVERKEFKPVNFPSPVLNRKNRTKSENFSSDSPPGPSWKIPDYSSDTGLASSTTTFEKRLTTSHSSPASGFGNLLSSPRLPKAQNPTITLLQKAREGHLPRGPVYIEEQQKQFKPREDRPPIANPGEVLYKIKNEYTSESDSERPQRKMADLGPRKFEGIGPVSRDGMPLILRSEVKDQNQSKWYKRMYDTIHKQKPHNDEYVTVRYKQKRAQYPYTSGYLSEPEPGAYDSDFTDCKYQTLDRRRPNNDERHSDYVVSSTMPRNTTVRSSDLLKASQTPHRTHPGRIENYTPGHSSISQKEAKEWWDEVMDIFDGHLEQQKRYPPQKSFINQALKESGYESDSTLVFRRREEAAQQQLSPKEQREAYKQIQKGGDVPLHGLRKPAPERPKESPRKYVENEVTIHYKTPVRHEIKDYISEDELAYRQAENMNKIYQEERRKKYLQELQDINSRRHTDNFIPSQKSPISLNRYDDFEDLAPTIKPRPRSPEPRLVAKALYNFVGQTARELTFRKGDIIYVRRQVDKNWYEGELNAMVGLFPTNYVEIVPYDGMKTTPRKSHEGQARAKYNFLAQTHLELSLAKGELVVITRKVDDNWFEGKIGGRKGIFPASYVEVLIDPHDPLPTSGKPVAAPAAHSLLLNGSSGGKESMGSHYYTPTSIFQASRPSGAVSSSLLKNKNRPNVDQALHIETQSEPVAYRALYKYLPQNEDELELLEGDTVYVLEKCDDGWYVGSSNRTGAFGTFPGNYVEKI